MSKARWAVRGVVALALLVALSPALYHWGSTWLRGPVEVEVDAVFPIGNKGTLEAKLVLPDGTVHRVLNRDQEVLFWKIDSEGLDNKLSTARKQGRRVAAWISGVYMPLFGDKTLFNHLNVVAVDPALPPGALPAAVYGVSLVAIALWLRRALRSLIGGARRLSGRDADRAR